MIKLAAGIYVFNRYGVVKVATHKLNRRGGQVARKAGWNGGGTLAKATSWMVFNIGSMCHSDALEILQTKNLYSPCLFDGDTKAEAATWVKDLVMTQIKGDAK